MIYSIPIIYQRCDDFVVEADNLQEAVEKALKVFLSIPDENYLDDSFEVDTIIAENYAEEYDVEQAIQKIDSVEILNKGLE